MGWKINWEVIDLIEKEWGIEIRELKEGGIEKDR